MALFLTRRLCNLTVIFLNFSDSILGNIFLLANAVDIDISSSAINGSDSCTKNTHNFDRESFSCEERKEDFKNTRGDDENGSSFYAWPQNESTGGENMPSLLAMLFPDLQALERAWENHPLLSKVSFEVINYGSIFGLETQQMEMKRKNEIIPTVFHNRSNLLLVTPSFVTERDNSKKINKTYADDNNKIEKYSDPILSVMTVDDIPTILMQPSLHQQTQQLQPMIQGQDYKLVKKVLLPDPYPANPSMAGQEYMGMLPKPYYDIQEILHYFHYGGFSLVLDSLQNRWIGNRNPGGIGLAGEGGVARHLEEELGAILVGVNAYLTPEALSDDGPLGSDDVDISGNSRSNQDGYKSAIAEKKVRQGFEAHWDWMDVIVIQLSGRKRWSIAREPTIYLSNKDQKRKPTQDELQHYIHSAKYRDVTLCPGDVLYIPRGFIHNASTVDFDEFESGNNGGVGKWDVCPTYSLESQKNSDGDEREILMRQYLAKRLNGPSLHVTFGIEQSCEGTIESLIHHALHSYFSIGGGEDSVAITAKSCNTQLLTLKQYDVTWKSILHHTFAEIARRKHPCDNPSYHDTGHATCVGSVTLRRSVPLLLISLNESRDDDVDGGVSDLQYAALKRTYLTALDVVASLFDIQKTAQFISSHLLQPHPEGESSFCFPGYSDYNAIYCPKRLLDFSESMLSEYKNAMNNFLNYAGENFDVALVRMNTHGKKIRRVDHDRQNLNLRFLGQGDWSG